MELSASQGQKSAAAPVCEGTSSYIRHVVMWEEVLLSWECRSGSDFALQLQLLPSVCAVTGKVEVGLVAFYLA